MGSEEHPNPVAVLTEKRSIIDNLIENGLAAGIYEVKAEGMRIAQNRQPGEESVEVIHRQIENRRLVGAIIQVSDNEVVFTSYENLQMQLIKIGENSLEAESLFNKIMTSGSGVVVRAGGRPIDLFRQMTVDFRAKVVADSADKPKIITDRLASGIPWLRQKQQEQLKNRTVTTEQFNQILGDFLKPPI